MKATTATFDVLGFGTVAVDELIVAETYPPPDAKSRVQHAERQCGGLTAIALIAAARLGAKCAYAGVLGEDKLSQFALGELEAEGIDLRHLRRKKSFPPVHSYIVIDAERRTRNVFSHRQVEYKMPANSPPRKLIEASRVLFVDHSDLPSMIRAAKIARTAGIPVVADLERNSGPRVAELLDLVDHLIVSESFAFKWTGAKRPEDAVKKLCHPSRSVVAVTCGADGCYYREQIGEIAHQPIFPVKTVDTTGCGDVFHGAYAAALARGWPAADRMTFASAAAAMKAEHLGAQSGIPRLAALRKFLRQNKTTLRD